MTTATVAVATREREPPSIAVLPFVNRSSSAEDEYFSDGLADELLNVLAKIRGLRVAARSSAFTFKGKGATVADVGKALNVAAVLEGSVRKAGSRMRITVQLVNVADGYHLWSETYDRTFDDIFAVQDDIAQSVVQELRTRLLGGAADAKASQEVTAQVAAAAKGRATDPEAHRLFLQARYLASRNNRDDTAKAIGYLKQALELDRAFALAWTELAGQYSAEAGQAWAPVAEGYAQARDAIARALSLEPDLAEALAQMGSIQVSADLDWRGAEVSCRRALELAPGNARVVNVAGILAINQGRLEEAIRRYRQALEQDPLRPAAYSNLATALRVAGRFAEAEVAYRKALELAPQGTVVHGQLSLNLLAQGRGDEALAEALREPEEWVRLWVLAIIHHAAGRRAESDAALQALIEKHQDQAAYQVAGVYAARNELETAFQWLERAFDLRDPGLSEMKCEPLFRTLHADPRWEAFLRKMGLAD
jgi:TolB-like protein/Tfp pilus assembly protein PilF